jgi:7-keto-8-aminopelargonate synthetase-like enzyme
MESVTPLLVDNIGAAQKAAQAELEVMGAALAEEWGADYEDRHKAAQGAVRQFADKDFIDYLDQTGLSQDPRMARMFAKIADAVSEGGGLPGDTTQRGGGPSLADLEQEMAAFKTKYDKALFDRGDANHEYAKGERLRLLKAMETAKKRSAN